MDKIKVYGKAQNRTALGIVNAYLVMYPHATFEDLKKAFPDELNPDSGVKKNFILQGSSTGPGNWDGYFTKYDELLTTGTGEKVALVKMWTKPSFERLVSHAKQYGIVVAEFTEAEKGFGKKGSFRLEYLNGYVPPAPDKKSPKWWLFALIGLLLLGIICFFAFRSSKTKVVTQVVKERVVDTVYVQQIQQIQDKFNAAKFEKGKATLSDDAKFVLHDLAKLMEQQKNIKLKVVGYTSSEGDAQYNQKLSEDRSKAAVDFLISQGVDESRLSYEGKGSADAVDANNPEANRRTEFIIQK